MWMWMPRTPAPISSDYPTDPQIAHRISGRLRLRLASWPTLTQDDIEQRLRRVDGVLGVRANALTHGILLRFDPAATTVEHLLVAVRAFILCAAGDPDDTEALSRSVGAHAVVAIERSCEVLAADGLSASDTSPSGAHVAPSAPAHVAPSAPALPVYLTPLADVMAWANDAIAAPRSLSVAPSQPGVSTETPRSPVRYLVCRLLDVFRRLDTAVLALKALSALAGVACAATPLALVLSLVEIAQLLVDLHLRAIA